MGHVGYYSPEMMKQHLGDQYEEDAEYVLETHSGAFARVLNHEWLEVGLVPDMAAGEGGTMIVFKKVTPAEAFEAQAERAAARVIQITEGGNS